MIAGITAGAYLFYIALCFVPTYLFLLVLWFALDLADEETVAYMEERRYANL